MKERRAGLGPQFEGAVHRGRRSVASGETFSSGGRSLRLFTHIEMDLEVGSVCDLSPILRDSLPPTGLLILTV